MLFLTVPLSWITQSGSPIDQAGPCPAAADADQPPHKGPAPVADTPTQPTQPTQDIRCPDTGHCGPTLATAARHPKRVTWLCPFPGCGRPYLSRASLRKHQTLQHYHLSRPLAGRKKKSELYACRFQGCGASFVTEQERRLHVADHARQSPWPCVVKGCSQTFSLKCEWVAHLRGHVPQPSKMRAATCPFPGCHRQFTDSGNLRFHLRKHVPPGPDQGLAVQPAPVRTDQDYQSARARIRQPDLRAQGAPSSAKSRAETMPCDLTGQRLPTAAALEVSRPASPPPPLSRPQDTGLAPPADRHKSVIVLSAGPIFGDQALMPWTVCPASHSFAPDQMSGPSPGVTATTELRQAPGGTWQNDPALSFFCGDSDPLWTGPMPEAEPDMTDPFLLLNDGNDAPWHPALPQNTDRPADPLLSTAWRY